jgi:hypothetical protein
MVTIVLTHGAFADSSSWSGVVDRLQKKGHMVSHPDAVTDVILEATRAVRPAGAGAVR